MAKVEIRGTTTRDMQVLVDGHAVPGLTRIAFDLRAGRDAVPVVVLEVLAHDGLDVDLPDAVVEALQRSPVPVPADHMPFRMVMTPAGLKAEATPPTERTPDSAWRLEAARIYRDQGGPTTGHVLEQVNVGVLAHHYFTLPVSVRHTILRYLRIASWDECEAAADDDTATRALDCQVLTRALERTQVLALQHALVTAGKAFMGDAAAAEEMDRVEAASIADLDVLIRTWRSFVVTPMPADGP